MNGDTRSISAARLCHLAREMHAEALAAANDGGSTPPLDAEDEEFVLSVFGRGGLFSLFFFCLFLEGEGARRQAGSVLFVVYTRIHAGAPPPPPPT
jgi:hypothetical protein